ncbi:cupin domain-containing protein [Mycobacterium paraseoulense]|uniref:Cupin n=1 Tax=Mycobacterium paraseoulense TaxID=590652 RepID=A0A1X0IG90_9MYCO|nr:cupin domain-containing protein [Mycobacterium paraseoulense]MCV7395677.1 cupin domain-containing protein [Mycobacterium paraseoulense]ORB46054.1 cupin [Mycobacterium paraseoulense]BBZ72073.1 mannose-6-phosphate isomerase [Mycobacterium paraseoulense]
MATADGFHPDFDEKAPQTIRNRVHHIKSSEISSDTAQSDGLRRFAALSGTSVGAEKLWMGETHAAPATVSSNHHHGDSETAIYVRSGHPAFVFHDGVQEVRISASPGDYVFIPPYLPHREENPDPTTPAEVVIARSTQEAVVVNLPALYPL